MQIGDLSNTQLQLNESIFIYFRNPETGKGRRRTRYYRRLHFFVGRVTEDVSIRYSDERRGNQTSYEQTIER
jgi:hypothetical protein